MATAVGTFRLPVGGTFRLNYSAVRFEYSLGDNYAAPFSSHLIDPLDRLSAGLATASDLEMLYNLRNRSMLLVGDSTDANIWARLCHCTRSTGWILSHLDSDGTRPPSRDRRFVSCYRGEMVKSCNYRTLNLQFHFVDASYGALSHSGATQSSRT